MSRFMKRKHQSSARRKTKFSAGSIKWVIIFSILAIAVPFTVVLTKQPQDSRNFAQEPVGVTPQFGCLGPCPTLPPGNGNTVISSAPEQTVSMQPAPSTTAPNDPNGEEPCEDNTASLTDHRDKNKDKDKDRGDDEVSGLFERLIELLKKLLELLGGSGIEPGTPDRDKDTKEETKVPEPQPEQPKEPEQPKQPDEQNNNEYPCPPKDESKDKSDNEETTPSEAPMPAPSGTTEISCNGATCAFEALVAGSKLISKWGDPRSGGRTHEGVDLGQTKGTACKAIENGVVTTITSTDTGLGGITLSLKDDKGRKMYYAHLEEPPSVKVGERVTRGQTLCKIDNTGNAKTTPSHLHYQVSTPEGSWADPEQVLKDWPN